MNKYHFALPFFLFITSCSSIPLDQQQLLYSGSSPNYYSNTTTTHAIVDPRLKCLGVGADRIRQPTVSDLYDIDFSTITTIEIFCDNHRNTYSPQQAHCFSSCEQNLASDFERIKIEQEQRATERAEEYAKKQEIQKQNDIIEKEKIELEENLKNGTVQPENLQQAKIVFNSKDGENIVISPKLKPDGGLYHLIGTIEKTEESSPEFIGKIYVNYAYAALSPKLLSRNPYFYVKIPAKELQETYFNNARINGSVSLIGRYVSNIEYSTTIKETKVAPLFEAVYLDH
ncbi:hypothetical protein R2083_06305 [Nitrosomonas sp. Is35]|uniref:hypothetical protein n=1 Tax=Nitrosomonas sp. Is35 TaxID=3080534 RepID=UPI00294B4512|nr:hypothetical protein [Nitrosomonas sp. Is35]MDV6347125.1 hypothetical protein [Nitrosomonas sp. Is35]